MRGDFGPQKTFGNVSLDIVKTGVGGQVAIASDM